MGCFSSRPTPSSDQEENSVVLLLLGPVGSDAVRFAECLTGQQTPDSLNGSLRGPSQVQIYGPELIHSGMRVKLVVPTPFDNELTERDVLDEVEKWLSKKRKSHPPVHHIVYFAETTNHYGIKLVSSARNVPHFEKLCGTPQSNSLYPKISLVTTKKEGGEPQPLPEQWSYLKTEGARQHVFAQTRQDAPRLLNAILGPREKA